MNEITSTSTSIGIYGGIATWLALGPLAGYTLIWAIFVAWGAFAYDKLKDIDKSKHHLLVSSHPSPLSALRKYRDFPSFKGSKPFSKINTYLKEKIIW